MNQSTLTLVVPCYNPRPAWAQRVVKYFQEFSKAAATEVKLTLVNDGSTQNVSELDFQFLRQAIPGFTLLNYAENRGKGYALRQGVQQSTSDFYIFTDIDFPYTLESMLAIEQALLEKGGIAVGHRDQSYYGKVPLFRKVLSQSFRWFIKQSLNLPVEDSQCGLKGFDNSGKKIFLKTTVDRFLFDLEFLVLANKKVPIYGVPVQLKEGIVFTTMGAKILLAESGNFLKILLRRLS